MEEETRDLAPYVEQAHEHWNKLRELQATATVAFFQMGAVLKELSNEHEWKALGFGSFIELLSSPEVSIKKSSAYRMMGLYDTYFVKLKLAEQSVSLAGIDMHKLELIRPLLTPENWQTWVQTARSLGRRDLEMVVREARQMKALKAAQPVQTPLNPETEPGPPKYAAENTQLAAFHGEIVTSIVKTDDGNIVLVTDSGMRLTFYASGQEVRVSVLGWEPQADDGGQPETTPEAASA